MTVVRRAPDLDRRVSSLPGVYRATWSTKSTLQVQVDETTTERFDAVFFGTGFDIDIERRGEIAAFVPNIKLWGDVRSPEEADENPDAALYPYLGPGFELLEKEPGRTPLLGNIDVFN